MDELAANNRHEEVMLANIVVHDGANRDFRAIHKLSNIRFLSGVIWGNSWVMRWRHCWQVGTTSTNDALRQLVEAENRPGLSTGKGVPSMCDYSLHHVASRPARIEDKLVVTKFSNSITRGFAAVGEPHVAVCLLPGTEIAFDRNVECEPAFGIRILSNKKIGQRLARFRQINMDNAVTHHDALEFPDGQVVLLTRLCAGQPATVLQLPMAAHPAGEAVRREVREPSLLA